MHENNKDNFKAHNESFLKSCVLGYKQKGTHTKSLVTQITEFHESTTRGASKNS